ncbi:hypothetical protein OESDEN_13681 [Oesophagostomum dentatum]|uniref:Secreted protein n=1 Tax=Oesophagostomum dentatum TaxID=61180 RepID=A0A0B1SSS9_OESDE|nr:hypothetical protein OESDEN_13681 [Oesophagostomum dentatum]
MLLTQVAAVVVTAAVGLPLLRQTREVCPRCSFSIYIPRCNLLKDRKTCYTADQAKVQKRENGGKSCILTYQCPEPLVAYAYLAKTNKLQALRHEEVYTTMY